MSEEKIKNKTIKICLAGDNHGHKELIQKIIKDNPDCDYYFHTGDSMLEEEDIFPFESVSGNCDEMFDYPDERLYELCGHKILLFHGTNQAAFDIALSEYAKSRKADIVFYGHTHRFRNEIYDDIHFINPGSCYKSRNLNSPSYALVNLSDDGTVEVNIITMDEGQMG